MKLENSVLVSVNITTFNRASLLRRCLDSVLCQSYKNLEVIIVDDCSIDETPEILKEYSLNDSRIKFFSHDKNKGNAKARNTALKESKGKYIAFLDDDDQWIDKEKITKQVFFFENSNDSYGIVCTGVREFISSDIWYDKIFIQPKDIKKTILKGNGIIYNSTVLTKSSTLKKLGGFDEKMSRGVDSEFYRGTIILLKQKVHFMKEVTCIYDAYSINRMTSVNSKKTHQKIVKANIRLIKKYFKSYFFSPFLLWGRVRKVLAAYRSIIFE